MPFTTKMKGRKLICSNRLYFVRKLHADWLSSSAIKSKFPFHSWVSCAITELFAFASFSSRKDCSNSFEDVTAELFLQGSLLSQTEIKSEFLRKFSVSTKPERSIHKLPKTNGEIHANSSFFIVLDSSLVFIHSQIGSTANQTVCWFGFINKAIRMYVKPIAQPWNLFRQSVNCEPLIVSWI